MIGILVMIMIILTIIAIFLGILTIIPELIITYKNIIKKGEKNAN